MQSMLWLLHISTVVQIYLINFVHSESSHPNAHFKWWRKQHNGNGHYKHLIDEMTPEQLSHLQEEYRSNKIPIRHDRFSGINQVMCTRMGNCNASSNKKDSPSYEADSKVALQKNLNTEYLEDKLRSSRKSRIPVPETDSEPPVIEDVNENAAMPTNRSHTQETERRKQFADTDLSPVSRTKIEKLGTKEMVNQRFIELYGTLPPASAIVLPDKEEEKRLERLATEHFNVMKAEWRCKTPTPIIVSVSDIYHHPHKTYMPPCTKLFRCTEKSGCCSSETKRCMRFKTENVTLYFKVYVRVRGGASYSKVEGLTFQNDTECQCSDLDSLTKNKNHMTLADNNNSLINLDAEPQDESRYECNCPAPFSKRTMKDGTCICDCFDHDSRCLKYKRGESFINLSEKKCVELEQCTKPTCEHGDYLMKSGRCPKNPRHKRLH